MDEPLGESPSHAQLPALMEVPLLWTIKHLAEQRGTGGKFEEGMRLFCTMTMVVDK